MISTAWRDSASRTPDRSATGRQSRHRTLDNASQRGWLEARCAWERAEPSPAVAAEPTPVAAVGPKHWAVVVHPRCCAVAEAIPRRQAPGAAWAGVEAWARAAVAAVHGARRGESESAITSNFRQGPRCAAVRTARGHWRVLEGILATDQATAGRKTGYAREILREGDRAMRSPVHAKHSWPIRYSARRAQRKTTGGAPRRAYG